MYFGITLTASILTIFFLYNGCRASELARGFNENINWLGLDDGLEKALNEKKPIMALIHKTWCGACKALKPKFATDKTIEELSEKFVMVNIQDDEEPKDAQFSPDGGYIPRIFFLSSDGKVNKDLYNEEGNRQYKYFYSSPDQIALAMRRALESHTRDEL